MSAQLQRVAAFSGHRGPVYALHPLREAGHFLSASGDGLVVRWSLQRPDQGEVIARVKEAVFAMAVLRNKRWLLAGTESGSLRIIDLKGAAEARHFTAQLKGVFAVVELPDGRIATTAGDGTLAIWSVPDEASQIQLERHIPLEEEKVRGCAVSPDGRWLAVACGDGTVRILDLPDLNEQHRLEAHEGGAQAVAWHPGKPVLISGGRDGHLRTWHTDNGYALLHAWPAHKAGIYAIAFDPGGRSFATASRDKTAKLWGAGDLEPRTRLERQNGGHTHSVNTLCWSGNTLLTGADDRQIIAWSPADQNG